MMADKAKRLYLNTFIAKSQRGVLVLALKVQRWTVSSRKVHYPTFRAVNLPQVRESCQLRNYSGYASERPLSRIGRDVQGVLYTPIYQLWNIFNVELI